MYRKTKGLTSHFTKSVNEQPGSASVVLSVASSKGGMGYAAYGYKTAGVKALPLGHSPENLVPLTSETVQNETYPFSRFLYLVVNKAPGEPLPKLESEFLRYVLSQRGQQQVARDGYFPIREDMLNRQMRVVGGAEAY